MALLLMPYQVLITQYYYMDALLVAVPFFIDGAWLTVLSQVNLHLSDFVPSRLTSTIAMSLNVYLPTEYRTVATSEQLKNTLGDLRGLTVTVSHDVLVIAGDWNTDTQHSSSFTSIVHSFLIEFLYFADLNYADEFGFTYLGHNDSKSWLDHVSVFFCQSPTSILSMMAGIYRIITP